MLNQISSVLADGLVSAGKIKPEEQELYAYGMEMGISMAASLSTTLLLGFLFGMPLESIFFLAVFIPLRSYAGGYHASGHLKCYFLSCGLVVGVLLVLTLLKNTTGLMDKMSALVICCALIILITAPVQDENKPLDVFEQVHYARKARLILSAEMAVYAGLFFTGHIRLAAVIALALFILAGSLLIGQMKNDCGEAG